MRDLYREVKQYGSGQIRHLLPESTESPIHDEDQALIDRVWDVYGQLDGLTLSSITHREDHLGQRLGMIEGYTV
nr:hypothetical protein [Halolamina pelagica]